MSLLQKGLNVAAAINPIGFVPLAIGNKARTGNLSGMDPTRVGKADEAPMRNVTQQMGARSGEMFNKQVERYNPQTVAAQKLRATNIGPVQGMGDFRQANQQAQGNISAAGQVDPRTLAFLQAAQQGGANTAQSLDLLRAAAMGQGPSAAQAQMQTGVDQAIKAQMAAAGARGFNAAAMRGAQMQGAEMQQAAVNQAAMLRAQEMQAAQQAFAQGALSQEEMARQAAIQAGQINLQQDVARKQAIQDAINAYQSGAGQFAGLNADIAKSQAQIDLQTALSNQERDLQAGMFNSQMGLDAATLQQQGQLAYANLGSNLLSGQLGGLGTLYTGETGRQQAITQGRTGMFGSVLSAAGAGIGAGLTRSDKRSKTDIKPNNETESFLAALTDNSYRYKDPTEPGTARGTQYGPMAQDLAKTKMGRTAVVHTPQGMMVDSARGFLLALSGLANINQRLAKLEGK
jgi:hypothetical protein